MGAGNLRKGALFAGSKTRIQNTVAEQTVKNAAAYLHRIVAANGNAAVQTVTVKDDVTTLGVFRVPANDTRVLEFRLECDTSLLVTNSSTDLDTLVIYD